MAEEMDGLFSFYASHHAIRADKALREAGYSVELVPGPRELSPNCGVALRFAYARRGEALAILAQNRVQIDEVYPYRPRLAAPTALSTVREPRRATVSAPAAPTENSAPAFRFARLWGRS